MSKAPDTLRASQNGGEIYQLVQVILWCARCCGAMVLWSMQLRTTHCACFTIHAAYRRLRTYAHYSLFTLYFALLYTLVHLKGLVKWFRPERREEEPGV